MPDDTDVISSYGDGQAVDDGVLVAVTRRDRVTVALFALLTDNAPMTGPPPPCWPVPVVAFTKGRSNENPKAVAAALAVGIIDHHRAQAQRIHDDNIEGGIYTGYVLTNGDGRLSGFWPGADWEKRDKQSRPPGGAATRTTGNKVWLMPNEVGGMTLMFPSDY